MNSHTHNIIPLHDRPMASKGYDSYRYAGRYGWIMIGANSTAEALREASRSTSDAVSAEMLQHWDGAHYVPVLP